MMTAEKINVLALLPEIVVLKIYTIAQKLQQPIKNRFQLNPTYVADSQVAHVAQALDRGLDPETVDFGEEGTMLSQVTPASITLNLRAKGFKPVNVFWFEREKNGRKFPVLVVTMSRRPQDEEMELDTVQNEILAKVFSLSFKYVYPWANVDGAYPSDQYWSGEPKPFRLDTLNFNVYDMDTQGNRFALNCQEGKYVYEIL